MRPQRMDFGTTLHSAENMVQKGKVHDKRLRTEKGS